VYFFNCPNGANFCHPAGMQSTSIEIYGGMGEQKALFSDYIKKFTAPLQLMHF
jgi:hypothetical protein